MSTHAAKKTEIEASYDEVPYESFAYAHTHPAHASTVATLYGLKPLDFKTARVLEIGCAGGGNLLPLALLYPKAKFLGIDISQEQIAEAERQKSALSLGNIEFRQQDIMLFDTEIQKEKFDYIICHGVLSWVPDSVREKILDICSICLSPRGLATISYNSLPGWNALRSMREMMQYHTRHLSTAEEKTSRARALLDCLEESVPKTNPGYRGVIDDVCGRLKGVRDFYIYHDYLEDMNTQFYLHEFISMTNAHNLEYVGDSSIPSMYAFDLPPKAEEMFSALDDHAAREQYIDFINNRRFRTSIICKKGQKINRSLRNEQIMDYFLMPSAHMQSFEDANDLSSAPDPASAALLYELQGCREMPVPANTLIARAQKRLGLSQPKPVKDALMSLGIKMVLLGLINIHSECPHHVTEISEKPVAFLFARLEAASEERKTLTNVLRYAIPVNDIDKLVIRQLDGSKTIENIATILDGRPLTGDTARLVQESLKKLAKNGLLTA